MFGEYIVYVDEKVVGQINEGRLRYKSVWACHRCLGTEKRIITLFQFILQ